MDETFRDHDRSKMQKYLIAGKSWFYRNWRKFGAYYCFHCYQSEKKQPDVNAFSIVERRRDCLSLVKETNRSRDWTRMHDDIARLIVDKLWFYRDYRKFAATCSYWYQITKEVRGPFKQNLVSLVLPYNIKSDKCAFYQISDSRTYEFNLPELRDKIVYGCSKGWLVVNDENFGLSLLNPLTQKQIDLPERYDLIAIFAKVLSKYQKSFFDPFCVHHIISKVVLDNSSFSAYKRVAMIIGPLRILRICQLGDNSWYTPIDPSGHNYARNEHEYGFLNDVIFFKSRVYAIDRGDNVIVVDFDGPNYNMQFIHGPLYYYSQRTDLFSIVKFTRTYLVECSGDLLAIRRIKVPCSDGKSHKTHYFDIYQFEEDKETWRKIYGLGDKCIFLGQNESLSVTAVETCGYRPNCIYFADDFYCAQFGTLQNFDFGFQNDNGVFCLDDHTLQWFDISHSMKFWMLPSIWCQLKM